MSQHASLAKVLARAKNQLVLNDHQRKVVNRIIKCGTGELGSAIYACGGCNSEEWVPCSCRDRHCGRCLGDASTQWLKKRINETLPVPYFHVVFTLPHNLNDLFPGNETLLYNMALTVANETMINQIKRRLGGEGGIISVLHTWTSELHYHVHVHMIVAGGALGDDGKTWIPVKNGYLVPDKTLRISWRRNFLLELKNGYKANKFVYRSGFNDYFDIPDNFYDTIDVLFRKEWIVTVGKPSPTMEMAMSYLSRYIYKTAISDSRIIGITDDSVTIKARKYPKGQKKPVWYTTKIDLIKFGQRFVRHILPKGFQRIRYSGFLGANRKKETIPKIRDLIADQSNSGIDKTPELIERMLASLNKSVISTDPNCNTCKVPMKFQRFERDQELVKLKLAGAAALQDYRNFYDLDSLPKSEGVIDVNIRLSSEVNTS